MAWHLLLSLIYAHSGVVNNARLVFSTCFSRLIWPRGVRAHCIRTGRKKMLLGLGRHADSARPSSTSFLRATGRAKGFSLGFLWGVPSLLLLFFFFLLSRQVDFCSYIFCGGCCCCCCFSHSCLAVKSSLEPGEIFRVAVIAEEGLKKQQGRGIFKRFPSLRSWENFLLFFGTFFRGSLINPWRNNLNLASGSKIFMVNKIGDGSIRREKIRE